MRAYKMDTRQFIGGRRSQKNNILAGSVSTFDLSSLRKLKETNLLKDNAAKFEERVSIYVKLKE